MKKTAKLWVVLSLCLCVASIALVTVFALKMFSIGMNGSIQFELAKDIDITVSGATLSGLKKSSGSGQMQSFSITRQMTDEDVEDLAGYQSWENIALEFEDYANGMGKLSFNVKNNATTYGKDVMVRLSTNTDIYSSITATPCADFCVIPGQTHTFDIEIVAQTPEDDISLDDFELIIKFELVNTDDVMELDEDGCYSDDEYEIYFDMDSTTSTASLSGVQNCAINAVVPEVVNYEGDIYTVTAIKPTDGYYEAVFGPVSTDVVSVALPSTLTRIGISAFKGCRKLTGNLVLPNGVEIIEETAFEGCDGYGGSLTLSPRTKRIDECAFSSCGGFVGTLVIPRGIQHIGVDSFSECHDFETLIIREGLTTINSGVFYECGFDGQLVLPKSLTSIGTFAFAFCDQFIGTLVIPENVKTIGQSAFTDCYKFNSLVLPEGLEEIGWGAFSSCTSLAGKLVLPSTITCVDESVFRGCAFSGDLIIPEGVTAVYLSAFQDSYKNGGTLYLPSTLEYVEGSAFYNTKFSKVVCFAESPPEIEDDYLSVATVYVPDSAYGDYARAQYWEYHTLKKLSEFENVFYNVW